MKIRNVGKNAFIVDRVKDKEGKFIHQTLHPGQTADIEPKKAEKLLSQYPERFVKDGLLVQKPSEFEAAKEAAKAREASEAKAKAEAEAKAKKEGAAKKDEDPKAAAE